jgi:hypothetical protein
MGVPATAGNLERTSIILENLAAESYRTVRSAYYDVLLHGIIIRDDESGGMLDLIFSRRTYEFGAIYNFEVVSTLNNNMGQGSPDIASAIEAVRDATEALIERNFGEW